MKIQVFVALCFFCFGMDVAIHFICPFEEAPEIRAFGPKKFPEFEEADLGHFDPGVGLNAPEKIGATPGGETVPACRVPEKAQHLPHWLSV